VTVRSEGTGPVRRREALAGSGRGLAGLRDRVDATGGTIVAGPGSGEFVVQAAWPRP
jgi:signal transduction histidine kinase